MEWWYSTIMQKTTVMLHEETIDWLRDKAHKERTSIGILIRKAINVQRGVFETETHEANPEELKEKVVIKKESFPPQEKPWTQVTRCEYQTCRKDAIGHFFIETYSTDTGDQTITKHLCKLHKYHATKEGKVTQI